MTVKIAALAVVGAVDVVVFAATQINDLNVALNAITILIALIAAVPIIRSRRKDTAIAELKTVCDAQKAHIEQKEREFLGVVARAERAEGKATQLKEKASYLEGKLHAAEEYSAPQAFERMTKHLASLESTMAEALRANGELVMRNTVIQAALAQQLGVELPNEP